jgi:hypothetical protein
MENLTENTKPTGKKVWDKPRKIVIVTFPTYRRPSKG